MYTYNNVRCNHHKPPYKPLKFYNYCVLQNSCLTYCHRTTITTRKDEEEKNPQITPAMTHPLPVQETYTVHNGLSSMKNIAIITATDPDPPDPAAVPGPGAENPARIVQNIAETDTDDTSASLMPATQEPVNSIIDAAGRLTDAVTRFIDAADTKSCDKADEISLPELTQCVTQSFSSVMEQPLNLLTREACRLTDAVTHYFDDADSNDHHKAKHCGLLAFREWWELDEVNISVGGKLVEGIPISVKEDTMRVVNGDYSYFIPLRKVDYIRTADGFSSNT